MMRKKELEIIFSDKELINQFNNLYCKYREIHAINNNQKYDHINVAGYKTNVKNFLLNIEKMKK